MPVMAPDGNLEIVVDSTSKEVSPGEDAVFLWTAYNNDTLTSYDLSVSSEEPLEFSESTFTLEPGESHTITQTIETSPSDENNTYYFRHVKWEGTWYRGMSSGTIVPIEGVVSVTVINNTNLDENGNSGAENGEDDDNGGGSTPGFEPIFLLAAIFVILIILRKKRRKSRD
ncbi:MAG: hypothetical protein JSW00_02690 [Thermoplasmata archaeon]|nr:MAG: hypothetical protein JSW00_02690 [Thermoplasmata archaeon]